MQPVMQELKGPEVSPALAKGGRWFAGIAGLVLSLAGVLTLGLSALGLYFEPTYWGLVFVMLLGLLLGGYGFDVFYRAFFRDLPGRSLFDGRLGTARAVAGVLFCAPVAVFGGVALVQALSKDEPVPRGVVGGLVLFAAAAAKCAQVLWKKLRAAGNPSM